MKVTLLDCQNNLKNYAFIITDTDSNDCALIDTLDTHIIVDYLRLHNLNLKYILNTHHHNDHIGGNLTLKSLYPDCHIFGNKHDKARINGITHEVDNHDIISLFNNKLQFTVLNFDGHTMGHIGFYAQAQQWLFAGDTIFNLGCGRRFEGTPEIFHNTLQKISKLPPETLIYGAHEYTLDNVAFAETIIPSDYAYYQDFLKYCAIQKEKRNQNIPTVPFTLDSQIKYNPFLLCDHTTIKHHISDNPNHKASDIFGMIRAMKDNF